MNFSYHFVVFVQDHYVMDGMIDCPDESDENPLYHPDWNCTDGYFLCPDDLHCIAIEKVCDGKTASGSKYNGCLDESDEANCENWECAPDFWKCADNLQCIPARHVCSGRHSKQFFISF